MNEHPCSNTGGKFSSSFFIFSPLDHMYFLFGTTESKSATMNIQGLKSDNNIILNKKLVHVYFSK